MKKKALTRINALLGAGVLVLIGCSSSACMRTKYGCPEPEPEPQIRLMYGCPVDYIDTTAADSVPAESPIGLEP